MRNLFVKEFLKKNNKNQKTYFLTGDLGYSAFEGIQKKIKKRFINAGVGENNMMGVASGISIYGNKVFVYSIVPFLTFRCLEHIRNYICHNNLDVKLIGGGGGFSYNNQGISHNTFEDIAIIRTLPNIKIFSPGTKNETIKAVNKLFSQKGPAYIRLGKVPKFDYNSSFDCEKAQEVFNGKKLIVFVTGNIIDDVASAVKSLNKSGYSIKLVSIITIKPLDDKYIKKQLSNFSQCITIEENSSIGGLGSAISDIISTNKSIKCKLKMLALKDKVHDEIGSQKYLRSINGLGYLDILKKLRYYAKQ